MVRIILEVTAATKRWFRFRRYTAKHRKERERSMDRLMATRTLLFGTCLLVLASSATRAQYRGGPATERDVIENGWLRNYREGVELARATKKPLMVLVRCVP